MAIIIDEKEYRNLQEQVGYLTEEFTKIKQSLGDALPDPIAGPTGPTGSTGPKGEQGRTPRIGFGYGPLPTDGYENGDLYIARGTANGLTKGNVYLRVNDTWQLQLNLVGPQGPQGLEGEDVIANPVGAYSENLEKVDIDGTVYNILPAQQREWLDNLYSGEFYYDTGNNAYAFGDNPVYFRFPVTFDGQVILNDTALEVYSNGSSIILQGGLYQITDSNNDPIVICENLNDANGNARFVEGNLTTETISGVTFTYAKWSLSGSHLMIVLAGEIAANVTTSVENWASVILPNYIASKINPIIGTTYIAVENYKAYHSDWTDMRIAIAYAKSGDMIVLQQVDSDNNTSEKAHFRIQFDLLIDME